MDLACFVDLILSVQLLDGDTIVVPPKDCDAIPQLMKEASENCGKRNIRGFRHPHPPFLTTRTTYRLDLGSLSVGDELEAFGVPSHVSPACIIELFGVTV